ncbi:MAG TPA: hypothetical protein VFV42_11155 [Acidimicrobiales bacterium]|nr:hypothetical protein [Acidimicrobiales bacterium]
MTDQPPGGHPGDGADGGSDPWDAWRAWSGPSDPAGPAGSGGADPWDQWKSWRWDPGAARRLAGGGHQAGCGPGVVRLVVGTVIVLFLLSFVSGLFAEPEDLPADDLIAAIDALPATGPRDQRVPDAAAGETATFPAPETDTASMASAIQGVRPPSLREQSGASVYLLYEEATVAVQPAPGAGRGSEVVVFEDNRAATRRYPLLIGFPGWGGVLDDFDGRARSRGGIGGFRGGGGGFGK